MSFFFFPNLPVHILGKKRLEVIFKRAKNSTLVQKCQLFSSFKGQRVQLLHVYRSRICPAYIFIVDCLSPFYSALYFQGPRWQK